MKTASFLTITDQVAAHLRAEILRGRWGDSIPGKHRLAAELGVNNKTVEAALRQLEQTGLLIPQGAGRTRRIQPRAKSGARPLRIALLLHEREDDRRVDHHIELRHALEEAGHIVVCAPKSLIEVHFDPARVAEMVRKTTADGWLVCTDDAPAFACCHPAVACIAWASRPVIQRVAQWVSNISRGKPDIRQTLTLAHFIPGGTIGPV